MSLASDLLPTLPWLQPSADKNITYTGAPHHTLDGARFLKVSEIFTAEIRDLSSAGLGVCSHPSGRTVFVAGAWPGETGRFKIHSLKGWVGFASIVELTVSSAHRVTPACPAHGFSKSSCGGCSWMFIDYPEQLAAKALRARAAIERALADASSVVGRQTNIEPIWPAPQLLGYRNRAQFKSDGDKLGYLAAQSNTLVDIDDCPILSDNNRATLAQLREQLPNPAWRTAKPGKRPRRNTSRKPARIRYTSLDIDESVDANSALVNRRLPFAQANSAQNQSMQGWLGERLQLIAGPDGSGKKALELFCGSGNFTAVLAAAKLAPIIAVEAVSPALQQLQNRQLANVSTTLCDLYDAEKFASIMRQHKDADILLLDPPREGLRVSDGLFSKDNNFADVIYISCDLATFSRDLALFSTAGYRAVQIQPLDQFPQTPHIELLCHLQK